MSAVSFADIIQAALRHLQSGQLLQAETLCRLILGRNTDEPAALHILGAIADRAGNQEDAIKLINRALSIAPTAGAYLDLGAILRRHGHTDQAAKAYQQALKLKPDYAAILHKQACISFNHQRYDEAYADFNHVAALNPNVALSYLNIGKTLLVQEKIPEAIPQFNAVIAIDARCAEAYDLLAAALVKSGQIADGIVHYKKLLELTPNDPMAYYKIGLAVNNVNSGWAQKEAQDYFEKALFLKPDFLEVHWAHAMTIPQILEADEDLSEFRHVMAQRLDKLDMWLDADRIEQAYQTVGSVTGFFLAYQIENNRELLEKHGALCARVMKAWQDRNVPAAPVVSSSGPIRIGIVSMFIRHHSVWHAIMKGWLEHLDRNKFNIFMFSVDTREDEHTLWAMKQATHFETMSKDLRRATDSIIGKNLDVLIYPEIGMGQLTHQLANLRLCPIQMAAWGHPETTGFPTVDYFLSAEDFEAPEADTYYSETLVRLPHLGCCYHSPGIDSVAPDFASLGIRSDVPVLVSPGAAFKYTPDHDHVFAAIAKKLKKCQIVFFINREEIAAKLQNRLRLAFQKERLDFDATCIFIPWLHNTQFYGLLKRADVFLDTIGFSGFSTAMHGIECGLPMVTCKGRFMRGRLASGILHRLGLQELIADNDRTYVDIAVRLASDKYYNRRIRKHIEEKRAMLFDDLEPIKAFEELLIELAGRNRAEKLNLASKT